MKYLIPLLLLLSACSSPRERCIAKVDKHFEKELKDLPQEKMDDFEQFVFGLCAITKNDADQVIEALDSLNTSH